MLKVITGEASKGHKKEKNWDRMIKIMDKYTQLKRFHHDLWIKVYMYAFMFVDPETIPVEDHFPATKMFAANHKKI